MSCGKPHETPCTEVLDRVYGYLDGEIDDLDCSKIRQHLDECGPCLREYGLEEAVKRLVAKHCGCDPVPSALRDKVLVRIREVKATIEFAELRFIAQCLLLLAQRDQLMWPMRSAISLCGICPHI